MRMSGDHVNNPDNHYGYGIPNFVAALEMLGVEEVAMEENEILNVYPNPSNGNVHVVLNDDFDGITIYGMTVYGVTGSVVCNVMNVNELESVLNELSSGVYTIKISAENGGQVLKVVLTR